LHTYRCSTSVSFFYGYGYTCYTLRICYYEYNYFIGEPKINQLDHTACEMKKSLIYLGIYRIYIGKYY